LIQRYQQVEAQLDRSVRYSRKTGSEGDTTIQQAWYNGAGDPIKVAVEHISSAGRELTEYLSLDFDDPGAMFALTRKETTQPDGGTQIDESRQYFGNDGKLVRELRKSVWGSLVRTLIGKGSRMRIFRGPILQTDGSPTTGTPDSEYGKIVNYLVDLYCRRPLRIPPILPGRCTQCNKSKTFTN
jgi:hypothetical protein